MRDRQEELAGDLLVLAARLVRRVRVTHALPPGYRLLSLLDEQETRAGLDATGLSITRVAELDQCSQPTASAAVAQLADRGWVTKTPHPSDARASVVRLTPEGRQALRAGRRANAESLAATLTATGRSTADLATAVDVLRDLTEHADLLTPTHESQRSPHSPHQEGPK
ncbi:MarR family transcriptional regulator [Nocardioides sp. GY 10127]|nr:MarR family transcriptional regulator [Nocardioides sp. GY 10127]